MANRSVEPPLIVIVGPTASGKTALALKLAEELNGEIIAADSRTIYRGLDIGTAKPTKEEQARVPHWGIDLVNPGKRYSAAQFQRYAYDAIDDIRRRKKTPFLVGGTGLYVDSVVYNYSFVDTDHGLRSELETLSKDELKNYCLEHNISLPGNRENKRHLVNQILRQGRIGQRESNLPYNTHVVGITTDSELLKQRIHIRSVAMFDSSVIEESQNAVAHYGWSAPGLSGNIYQVVRQVIDGDLTRDEAIGRLATLDWKLAKRQMTWFKRDSNIQWFQLDEAEHYIARILAPE